MDATRDKSCMDDIAYYLLVCRHRANVVCLARISYMGYIYTSKRANETLAKELKLLAPAF